MAELEKKRKHIELKKFFRQHATSNRRIKKHFKTKYKNRNKNSKNYTRKACHLKKVLIIIKYDYQQPRILEI